MERERESRTAEFLLSLRGGLIAIPFFCQLEPGIDHGAQSLIVVDHRPGKQRAGCGVDAN